MRLVGMAAMCLASAATALPLDEGWTVTGKGTWSVQTGCVDVVWNGAANEATSALMEGAPGSGPVFRCRVEPGPDASAAGIWFAADPERRRGFLLSLDSVERKVSLETADGDVLWEQPVDFLTYYTPYWMEGIVEGGRVRAQVLSWNGARVLAQSPWISREQASALGERVGFHSEGGAARFYDWARADAPLCDLEVSATPESIGAAEAATGEPAGMGEGWRQFGGQWEWLNPDRTAIVQQERAASAMVIDTGTQASRGIYRCTVEGNLTTRSVGLLFQVSPDLKQGFELRLGRGVVLRDLGGRELFEDPAVRFESGRSYTLEGHVKIDRVSIRILDDRGEVQVESPPSYVSDTNNSRMGLLGFSTQGSGAVFRGWSIEPAED